MNRGCQRMPWLTTPHSSGRPNLARSKRHRPTARSTAGPPAADRISPAAKVLCSAGQRSPQSARLENRRHKSLMSRSGRRSRRRYAAPRTGERPNCAVIIRTGPPPASAVNRASGPCPRPEPAVWPGRTGLLVHWGSATHFEFIVISAHNGAQLRAPTLARILPHRVV